MNRKLIIIICIIILAGIGWYFYPRQPTFEKMTHWTELGIDGTKYEYVVVKNPPANYKDFFKKAKNYLFEEPSRNLGNPTTILIIKEHTNYLLDKLWGDELNYSTASRDDINDIDFLCKIYIDSSGNSKFNFYKGELWFYK